LSEPTVETDYAWTNLLRGAWPAVSALTPLTAINPQFLVALFHSMSVSPTTWRKCFDGLLKENWKEFDRNLSWRIWGYIVKTAGESSKFDRPSRLGSPVAREAHSAAAKVTWGYKQSRIHSYGYQQAATSSWITCNGAVTQRLGSHNIFQF